MARWHKSIVWNWDSSPPSVELWRDRTVVLDPVDPYRHALPSGRDYPSIEYVYFIGVGQSDIVKIGRTSDIRARVAALQTGAPLPLHVLAMFHVIDTTPCDMCELPRRSAKYIERGLHLMFMKNRTSGEWFRRDAIMDKIIACGAIEKAGEATDG